MSKAQPRSERAEREPLAGTIERVTYHNADNGFCVLRVRVRGRRDPVAVIGHATSVSEGEHIQASGSWENTVEHGVQFKALHLQTTPPSTAEGMQRYLGSGLIHGVGKELARRLVVAFGDRVFEVIDQHPERLRTVDGIGPKRLRRILEGWEEQKAVRDIIVFLQSHGVGSSRAVRIYKTYGADAVPLITENPYRLARDIRGIGFRTADEIAGRLGVPKDSLLRARAGVAFTLWEAVGKGHCGLSRHDLFESAGELLAIPREILEEALALELEDGTLVEVDSEGVPHVFLASLFEAEESLAEALLALLGGETPWPEIDAATAIDWAQRRLDVELSPSQRAAVQLALCSKVLVITGGPGVGKTTLMRTLLEIVRAKNVSVALCAPTGRAAKRLSESTGLDARTVHRLLEIDPRTGRFQRDAETPLHADLVVADEVSMIDVPLMSALVAAIPQEGALLLVGDVDQLPSVGPGQALRDVIDSGAVPVARLTEIFRQAEASSIVTNAHRINQHQMPVLESSPEGEGQASDFYFVEATTPEDSHRKLVEMVGRRIPRRFGLDPRRDVQVLCPMNRGPLGARTLNLVLQEALNPPRAGAGEIERFGWTYRVGDKVMQTENDYDREVFNGDVGLVVAVDGEEQEVTVAFEERRVVYRFGELDQLSLAYAVTIHKSQGSEYPAVLLTLAMQHWPMLRANLVYTGVTRGRQLVVILGEKRALAKAVRDGAEGRRVSRLRELLAGGGIRD